MVKEPVVPVHSSVRRATVMILGKAKLITMQKYTVLVLCSRGLVLKSAVVANVAATNCKAYSRQMEIFTHLQ